MKAANDIKEFYFVIVSLFEWKDFVIKNQKTKGRKYISLIKSSTSQVTSPYLEQNVSPGESVFVHCNTIEYDR